MFFFNNFNKLEYTFNLAKKQAIALLEANKGVDVIVREHTHKRTLEQNNYLFAVYRHIQDFYTETGFIIDGLELNFLTVDFLHEYLKARYGIRKTSKLSTKEMVKYIDDIQNEMVLQTEGEYQAIIPPDRFLEGFDDYIRV